MNWTYINSAFFLFWPIMYVWTPTFFFYFSFGNRFAIRSRRNSNEFKMLFGNKLDGTYPIQMEDIIWRFIIIQPKSHWRIVCRYTLHVYGKTMKKRAARAECGYECHDSTVNAAAHLIVFIGFSKQNTCIKFSPIQFVFQCFKNSYSFDIITRSTMRKVMLTHWSWLQIVDPIKGFASVRTNELCCPHYKWAFFLNHVIMSNDMFRAVCLSADETPC